MIKYTILCSGSKGNCTVIQSNEATIMIDCGYKIRYLKNQLSSLNLTIDDFDSLLITHTHSDHIQQLKHFKHLKTFTPHNVDVDFKIDIKAYDEFYIKDIKVTILPLSHDIEQTIGFLFETDEDSLVYICDTGYVSRDVQHLIKNKTYYILESNHDLDLLMDSDRSMALKLRIASDKGHLSNDACIEVLQNVIGSNTRQVVLAHISQQVNTYELAYTVVRSKLPNSIKLNVAKQDEVCRGGHD